MPASRVVTLLLLLIPTPSFADPFVPASFFLVAPFNAVMPAINNHGEIVYRRGRCTQTAVDCGFEQHIVSTRRDVLAPISVNGRFPDINDHGEVVYVDLIGPGLSVISTERGALFPGNLPSLNNHGEISAGNALHRPDGSLTILPGIGGSPTSLTDSGEIIYPNANNLFSTTRGQLTHFTGQRLGESAANNRGEFIYTIHEAGGAGLFWQDGTRLWDGPTHFYGDVNDFGDVVFTLATGFGPFADGALFLRTTRPEFYQGDGFVPCRPEDAPRCGVTAIPILPVPEPGSLVLYGLGLAVVYGKRAVVKRFHASGG